eukprot:scaffold12337_cov103-Isochrysis_galbana.AAC.3
MSSTTRPRSGRATHSDRGVNALDVGLLDQDLTRLGTQSLDLRLLDVFAPPELLNLPVQVRRACHRSRTGEPPSPRAHLAEAPAGVAAADNEGDGGRTIPEGGSGPLSTSFVIAIDIRRTSGRPPCSSRSPPLPLPSFSRLNSWHTTRMRLASARGRSS